jgi:hypothetical protein
MTYIRGFVSGLILMVLPLQACGILQTTPSDAALTDTCSKSDTQPLHAQGTKPPSSHENQYSMTGSGFP